MIKSVEKLEIQNIDLVGNLEIKGEGSHKGKVTWKNGKFYGTYNYITTENAVLAMIDHQTGLLGSCRDQAPHLMTENIKGL